MRSRGVLTAIYRGLHPALVMTLTVLVLVGCTVADAGPTRPRTLADYTGQELEWGPCDGFARNDEDRISFQSTGFRCAYLEVPLDYDDPAGRLVRIGVLRRQAAEPDARIGSLVINPGGPGASGMSAAARLARRLAVDEVTRRFDLVGFDPRGVGSSEPTVVCRTAEERDAERADLDLDTSPAGVARAEAEEREFAQNCADRTGVDVLARIGSRDVARDMDVLRAALGDERLTYLGYSYGTRIGTAYAAEFPDRVRAMVLDGALDPDRSPTEALVAQAAGFQQAFDAFAAWCAGQECPLGPDPVAGFRALVEPLVEGPVPAGGDRELHYPDAVTGALQALYSTTLWEPLRTGLTELAAGTGPTLLALADLYHDRQRDGSYTTSADVLTAVRCVDDPRTTDPDLVAETDARVRAAAPFLDDGRGASAARGACAFWPAPPAEPVRPGPLATLPTVVVVSTTGDPATPYEAGVALAEALRARLVTVEGEQHTAYLTGIPCLDEPVTGYLVDPARLPPDGLTCEVPRDDG
jgi:pimeloyl-ACP methyl ester carboxylesterase